MPERRSRIPITGIDLARRREKIVRRTTRSLGSRAGSIGRQRFVSDTVETDWQKYVAENQVFRRQPPLRQWPREIIVPIKDVGIEQKIEVHPEGNLLIVLHYPGIHIAGSFLRVGSGDGKGEIVFCAPSGLWKNSKVQQVSLYISTLVNERILKAQVVKDKDQLFQERVSLMQLANYDPELKGIHPNVDNYDLANMEITSRGNIVAVIYPEQKGEYFPEQ